MPDPSALHQVPTGEVTYRRMARSTPARQAGIEIESLDALREVLARDTSLAGLRWQGLALGDVEATLMQRKDFSGLVVLGGEVSMTLEHHLRVGGAIIFPAAPDAPVRPYRGTLYTAEELYEGVSEHGYEHTPDAMSYAWAEDACLRHDAYVTVLRAIHDDAMSDALAAHTRNRPVVGVMGGHALARGTDAFAQAAQLGHALANAGCVVATGGGPGAMEAANLGAWAPTQAILTQALEAIAAVPNFAEDIGAWALAALEITRAYPQDRDDDSVRSLAIPTWFYGHEPPNVFGDHIAKFFSNAVREDLLLEHSTAGLVVLPGAAGTTQEIFQMSTRMYYEKDGPLPPMILVGKEHWNEKLPVWPLLQALGAGRPMGQALHLVDSIDEVPDLIAATP